MKFAEGRVHAYGTKIQLMAAEETVKAAAQVEEPLLLERANKEVTGKEVFHYMVLSWIKLIYQILIGCVIGFMTLHQILDFRRARKKIQNDQKEL